MRKIKPVIAALLAMTIGLFWSPAAIAGLSNKGVLILAHGGTESWNASIRDIVAQAELPYTTDIAFGMGMSAQEAAQVQEAVNRLEAQGATEILVVPLLVSSYSEVYRQYEYLLGVRSDSPWAPNTPPRVTLNVPVRMGSPLDAHPYVADILVDRAQALSKDPAHEVVVLVAHGPVNDQDNTAWIAQMQRIARLVQQQGHFARVEARTLRDDAPEAVQQQATQALRRLVAAESQAYRVLVVPLLMARGGIEHKIPERLHGLTYVYSGETLVPHPRIASWIHDAVDQLSHAIARLTRPRAQREPARNVGPIVGT